MSSRQERPSVVRGFPHSTHRYSAASGVGFVLFLLASTAAFGVDYPSYDDSGQVFAAYYAEHDSAIRLSAFLAALAVLSLVWFIGFIRWLFHGAEIAARGYTRATDIGFGAGVGGSAAALVAIAAHETAVVAQGTVEPGMIRALDLFGDYALVLAALLLAVWLLTAFFVIRVTQILSEWVGWLAAGGALLGILQSALLAAPQDDDGVFGLLGIGFMIALAVWVAVVSVTLVRRVEAISGAR